MIPPLSDRYRGLMLLRKQLGPAFKFLTNSEIEQLLEALLRKPQGREKRF